MTQNGYIPFPPDPTNSIILTSLREAARLILEASALPLENLGHSDFIKAWFAVAYAFPGLHPDGYDTPGDSWPRRLLPLAKEAWQRTGRGELSDEFIYPSDAQWAGLCDRLNNPSTSEARRRRAIHARYPIVYDQGFL